MEGELWNLCKVFFFTTTALYYSYFHVSKFRSGKPRLVSLLPVFALFSLLPLSFSLTTPRVFSALFLTWLANFKLILFAFSKGPLSNPILLFPLFVAASSLPIDITPTQTKPKIQGLVVPLLDYAVKGLIISFLTSLYPESHSYPRIVVEALYSIHVYLSIELVLVFVSTVSRVTLLRTGLELEPQFSDLWLSTSLQNFWGKRWNLAVSRTLRLTVYVPIRKRWGTHVGIMAAFAVSGLMHEVLFYYLTFRTPTGEWTCFFVIHGVCTAAEVAVKRALGRRGWRPVPTVAAAPVVLVFVWVTVRWLVFPPFLASDVGEKVMGECLLVVEMGKRVLAVAAGIGSDGRS